MSEAVIVIDFGVVDTVAVLRRAGDAPQPVVVDGEVRVPSAVGLNSDHQLIVGREALELAGRDPDHVVRDLYTRMDRHDVMVGDIVLPVQRLLRALLSRIVRATGTEASRLVLTHPAGWSASRITVLTRAAAGLAPLIDTATAPLAAAAGADLGADQTMLVLELDGDSGTATTVRRRSGRLAVLSSAELPPENQVAKLASAAAAVLVVGRSARTPQLTQRLTELGAPVRAEADPATAVARGATVLLADRPRRGLAGLTRRVSGLPRPWPRRVVLSVAGVVLVVAIGAVLALGWGPGVQTAGNPGPAAGELVDSSSSGDGVDIPPPVKGQEIVTTGQPTYTAVRLEQPARYRGADGAELEIVLKRVWTTPSVPVLGAAPTGYRWLVVEVTGSNVSNAEWEADYSGEVSLIDDRGLWIHPLGDGVVECSAGAGRPPEELSRGQRFDACVTLPVPNATPVSAVAFGARPGDEQAPSPLRAPVSVPAVARAEPAAPQVVGSVGDPPVEVTLADSTMHAGFDVVLTPSGYVGERRPGAGNRFVVVRAALGPASDVFLRDDRGVLSRPVPGFDRMPQCPPLTDPGTADHPVYACFVYELSAASQIAGVTYGDLVPDAPLSGKDIERWLTWTST